MSRATAPRARLDLLWVFFYGCVGLIGLRLFDLQLLRHGALAKAAEKNRTQLVFTSAPRGRLFDRKGALIAASKATFSLIYLPGATRAEAELEQLARTLAPALKVKPEEMVATLKRSARRGIPVRLAQGLSRETMFRLSEVKTLYPGMNLVVEAQRDYPNGAFASHAVGYLGDMDARSLRFIKETEGYRMDSKIGKSGLERLFEKDLRGTDGGILLEVDARGRLKQVLNRVPSTPGNDLHLTLDTEVQKAAEAALRKSITGRGAVVALEPDTGRLLALASVPDFDPNWFVELPTEREAGVLKDVPEFNLATQGVYAPGSVFKIITAAAAFNEGRGDPKEKVRCPGFFELGDRVFNCWKKEGHGDRAFIDGMRDSCDVYFYTLGLKAGGGLIERYQAKFGIGQVTGLPLPGEAKGAAFGPVARLGKRPRWRQGDTVNLSVGQGGLLVTPAQMAVLMGGVATRGTMYRPYLVSRLTTPHGSVIRETAPEVLRSVDLKPAVWDQIHESLVEVAVAGTGKGVRLPGLMVAGKTGTAENPHGEDHAWFAAYAGRPGEPPKIALAVLVQHGGHGGESAVPVARAVIETFFEVESPESVPPPAVRPFGPGLAPAVR